MYNNIYAQVLFVSAIGVATIGASPKNPCGNTNSSDFSQVVKNDFFVDKSLLVRDLFIELFRKNGGTNTTVPVSVLAGPHFGKTSNHDMIKRFLQVPVDGKGNPVDVTTTSNFEIFKGNNLNIYKDYHFFHEHFGMYPVIYINCKPLAKVVNFDDLIEKYKGIVSKTFLEHKYLLSVDSLWLSNFNKSYFESYLNADKHGDINKYNIYCAFSILAKVLNKHFDKPVFVLVDDFDAVQSSPAYETGEDKNRIFDFLKVLNNDIFSSSCVKGGLLTGSLKTNRTITEDLKTYHKELTTLDDTDLWKYYGLSSEELRKMLSHYLNEDRELEETVTKTINQYSGLDECVNTEKSHPCSVWSAMKFFEYVKSTDLDI